MLSDLICQAIQEVNLQKFCLALRLLREAAMEVVDLDLEGWITVNV